VLVRTPLLLLLNDQLLLYYCLAMINTALGLSVHAFFFVPLLLDIVVQSRLLQKVHLVHLVHLRIPSMLRFPSTNILSRAVAPAADCPPSP